MFRSLILTILDRRHPNARKELAQEYLSTKRDRDEAGFSDNNDRPTKSINCIFSVRDCCVVPYMDAETKEPSFHFARVVKINLEVGELVLMELKPHPYDPSVYRAHMPSVWTESFGACYHVLYSFDNTTGDYRLLASEDEILALVQK